MTSKQLVWLITGTSTGLGREMALQALERGDKVIATARARSLGKLDSIKEQGADILELDVTAPFDTLHEFAKKAVAIHGRVDVLVNNAGFAETGALEELTPEETYAHTNVFGPLNVCRAFLPYMRQRRSGTVVWIGSLTAHEAGNAGFAMYSATKHALRCISESLDKEISPLGLRSLSFEFGYFRTDLLHADHRSADKERISDYAETAHKVVKALETLNGNQPGDPKKGVKVVLDFVRGEGPAAGREIPSSIIIGSDSYDAVQKLATELLKRIEEWKEVIVSTDLPKDA